MTLDQLSRCFPRCSKSRLALHYPHLVRAMSEAQINTVARVAAFLAQVGLESGEFEYMEEIASGAAYEAREDLGNLIQGDGVRFKGRGSIQLTGRLNYTRAGKALGLDLVNHPELAAKPENAHRIAAWFWKDRALNGFADLQTPEGFMRITRAVNGVSLTKLDRDPTAAHHDRRVRYLKAAMDALT